MKPPERIFAWTTITCVPVWDTLPPLRPDADVVEYIRLDVHERIVAEAGGISGEDAEAWLRWLETGEGPEPRPKP